MEVKAIKILKNKDLPSSYKWKSTLLYDSKHCPLSLQVRTGNLFDTLSGLREGCESHGLFTPRPKKITIRCQY